MVEQRVVQVSQEIDASPEAVFRVLTQPLDLTFWFCHEAWTDPRPGGDFQVRWRNGWWARGVYQMVERPRRIELSWWGKDEPGETNVVFEVEALDQGTVVKVIHSGFGGDAVWDKAVAEAEGSWPRALENMQSVLSTGVDLREANRPMLGIVPEELTPERAADEGVSVDSGVFVADVLEDGGAAAAGLRRGDVITSIDAMSVSDWQSLTTTLAPHRAGDQVQIGYVRGGRRGVLALELKPRPIPEISFDPQQVVERAREARAGFLQELRHLFAELTEQEASERPSADEWSVKEILAHLSLNERFSQRWFADIVVGTGAGQSGGNPTAVPEALAMTLVAAPTVEALLDRLEHDMGETLAMVSAFRPEVVAMKARYRAMANSLLSGLHIQSHINQIEATIDGVKRER